MSAANTYKVEKREGNEVEKREGEIKEEKRK
jgi:hypothetical protein